MANYSISASQITEGKNVFIRGKLGFAVLARLIEGAELVASDQRKTKNGMNPVGKPHTTATIIHAEVQFADPNNPTLEEQFVSERRYDSPGGPKPDPTTPSTPRAAPCRSSRSLLRRATAPTTRMSPAGSLRRASTSRSCCVPTSRRTSTTAAWPSNR